MNAKTYNAIHVRNVIIIVSQCLFCLLGQVVLYGRNLNTGTLQMFALFSTGAPGLINPFLYTFTQQLFLGVFRKISTKLGAK